MQPGSIWHADNAVFLLCICVVLFMCGTLLHKPYRKSQYIACFLFRYIPKTDICTEHDTANRSVCPDFDFALA
jgi:hypothetical protein